MLAAGFVQEDAINPYWNECGGTFRDKDGYRVILTKTSWTIIMKEAPLLI
jgi:hypothetical protein